MHDAAEPLYVWVWGAQLYSTRSRRAGITLLMTTTTADRLSPIHSSIDPLAVMMMIAL